MSAPRPAAPASPTADPARRTDGLRRSAPLRGPEDWRRLGLQDATLSVLDIGRRLADRAHDPAPIVRALADQDVFFALDPHGCAATSTFAGTIYVHLYSSPLRLAAARPDLDRRPSVQGARFGIVSTSWPSDTGLRLDPGTQAQLTLDPPEVRQARALAAGVPVPAAFRAVEGERLVVELGPVAVAPLDEQVRDVVRTAAPEARLRRRAVFLDGVAGRSWPVYDVVTDGVDGRALVESVEREVRRPVALVVDGRPQWLARRVELGSDTPGLQIP